MPHRLERVGTTRHIIMLQHILPETSNKIEYDRIGFHTVRNVIEEELLDLALAETKIPGEPLDRWKRQKANGILQIAYHPEILKILTDLYDREPFPFQTLNFDKSPAIGLHCDTIHFNTEPYGWMCGVWIALEDVTMDNGPLQYFPESHKLPVVRFEDIGLEPKKEKEKFHRNLGQYSSWLENRNRELGLEPETLTCKRGTVFIWHANLMHRSITPKPGTTRASQVTHYYFKVPGIRYTVPAFGIEKGDALNLEERRHPLI